jgi:YfiH family protein
LQETRATPRRFPWTERTAPNGAAYVAPETAPEGAEVYFFTRKGGASAPPFDSLNVSRKVGDEEEAVVENRRLVAEAMGVDDFAWVRQVAGDALVRVSEPGFHGEADALVTGGAGLALGVSVADCVPVALVGSGGVAMVHSGWRGTISGICGKAVRELGGGSVRAYVGPAIRGCCYEVSEELAGRFASRFGPGVVSGRMLDLPAAVGEDLRGSGVAEVRDLGLCTACRTDLFYSHRKEGPATGRNLSAVVMRGDG